MMALTTDPGDSPSWLTFPLLSQVPDLVAAVFTRHGGVSRPPYATLNVAWANGDARQAVEENLARIRGCLGIERLVSSRQVHGDAIQVVDESTLSANGAKPLVVLATPGDALVTGLRQTGLVIKIADCQAVFLVDPQRHIIANVHCGWRGSVKNIPGRVVGFLRDRSGCRPEQVLAAVSPSLGPCCAEFRHFRDELPPSFWPHQVKPLHFDFWEITRRQLIEAGLHPGNIEIAGSCTVCATHDYFSYRREGLTGRLAAVLAWK
jgi:hypothetical protein